MGNQQEIDLAYIAGILDGEGCISLTFKEGKEQGKGCFNRVVQMTNTSHLLIDYLVEFLTTLDVNFHVKWVRIKGRNHKPCATIGIQKLKGIKKFLNVVLPFLKVKKRQAVLMLEFVDSRLQTFKTAQRNTLKWSYTQRELEISKAIRALNAKGI